MSEVKAYAMNLNVNYRSAPATDEIEAETDLAKAEETADKYTIKYLKSAAQVHLLECQVVDARRRNEDDSYIFGVARRKYLELKSVTGK